MKHFTSKVSKNTYRIILDRDEDGLIFARCNELHANAEGKIGSQSKRQHQRSDRIDGRGTRQRL
jgi:hypothetical protein